MKWFRNLTIGAKLILGFSIMILLMGIIGFTGYRSTVNIKHNLNEIFAVRLPSINYLIQADRDLQQLLVAERSMVFANANSEVFRQLVKDYEENLAQSQQRWEKYKALRATGEEKAIMPQYDQARAEWKAISTRVVEGRVADTREGRREALDLTLGAAKEKFEEMRNYLDQLTNINLSMAQKASDMADDTYRTTLMSMFTITGFGLIMGILLMWGLGRGITRPLKAVISGLTDGSEQVAAASEQVAQAGQLLAEGSSEQAASLQETSSSLEEMASMTRQNAANAEESASASEEMNTQAQQMKTFVDDLVALVGSSSNKFSMAAVHGRTTPAAPHAAGNRRHKGTDLERPVPAKPTNKIKQTPPEQIIPLDADFEDF